MSDFSIFNWRTILQHRASDSEEFEMKKDRSQAMNQIKLLSISLTLLLMPFSVLAQGTRIEMPKNKYSIEQDVQLGKEGAAEVKRQLPILPENSESDRYVESVGRRLVAAIPQQFQQPKFVYQFDVVNASDINAFALPGGPMFVNRGMIEAANTEGEMAGVMAHEISHVVLRHGTANASKQQSAKAQLPAIGGAILGAIIGGGLGGVVAQTGQLGTGIFLTKYSREYETQADILGSQILARAGYDPRDLANMFRTIEKESGGSGGPEWLSTHPNPGNRYERIEKEASLLRINRAAGSANSAEFSRVQAALRRMPPAQTMSEIANRGPQRRPQQGETVPSDSRIEQRVDYPSATYRSYSSGNLFRVNIPSNWQQFGSQDSVTFAPRGAYGDYQGQNVFTHGAIAGLTNPGSNNLQQATDRYIDSLLQSNGYLRPQGQYRTGNLSGRRALSATLAGRSPVTGRNEVVDIYTTFLSNGSLFYLINVAPQDEYQNYQRAFREMVRSLQLR
jgi:beta-barrel assembly-enhancing protease